MSSQESSQASADAQHRPDIDGLRAIAILSVLGFHAFGRLLPGGFVGVDIFFVISGYLISGILLRGLKNGDFSFTKFYSRRIKRIFPALFLVLGATWVAGWYLLLPDEYARLGKHIASGAGFVSNITLWKEAGYFDQRSALKPLLHLWSLGVEEQFYLIWPVLLFVAWKRRIDMLATVVAILAASFTLNVLRVHTHEAATFYLPGSRFWELLLGGAFACWQTTGATWVPRIGPLGPTGANLTAALGLALTTGSALFLDGTLMFPGWWALLPTLGALLLIMAGPQAWINRRLLASRLMVFIGVISYPLYLWHWPLLSFDNVIDPGPISAPRRVFLLLVAALLAWLTYRLVERPIRSNPALIPVAWRLAALVAVIGTIGFVNFKGSLPPRSARYGLEKIIQAANSPLPFPGPRLEDLDSAPTPLRRQSAGAKTALFIGDSFIEQYYPRVDWLLRRNPSTSESVVYASNGGCPPIPNVREDHHPYCIGLVDRALAFAADPNVNVVVIGANWMGYFAEVDPRYSYYVADGGRKEALAPGSRGSALAMAELRSVVARLIGEGKAVYLILQSPRSDALDPRNMIGKRWGASSFQLHIPVITRDDATRPTRPVVLQLRAIAAATGATVIDPMDYLCREVCPVMTSDGVPIYRDEGHLNPAYVRNSVGYLDGILRLPPDKVPDAVAGAEGPLAAGQRQH